MKKLPAIVRLIRPLQWVKNAFVAAPLFFSGQLFSTSALTKTALGVAIFSLTASALYVINDWRDREADRQHPRKCGRPLAAGVVAPWEAVVVVAGLIAACATLLWCLQPVPGFLSVIAIYVALTLGYSFGLKHLALVELFVVASGYVLRVIGGAQLIGAAPSPWILAATGLAAFLIASAKRRADMHEDFDTAGRRGSLKGYTVVYLDHVITMAAGITIIAYILFTLSPYASERFNTDYLVITSIFVVYGVVRYLQLVMVRQGADDPTQLILSDPGIIASVLLWGLSLFCVIYVLPSIGIPQEVGSAGPHIR